jgi:hypothetical protein
MRRIKKLAVILVRSIALRDEGAKKIRALAERGFDLGYGCDENYGDPPQAKARVTESTQMRDVRCTQHSMRR